MGYREEDRTVPKRAGSASSEAIIRDATINCLTIADTSSCRSIAFPALATGVGGFPVDECARVMMKAAKDYTGRHPESIVERVLFVLFTESDFKIFQRELEQIERG
jgi:O-acetyl-ADP-ribose deacetylase (regulator of RNase III)